MAEKRRLPVIPSDGGQSTPPADAPPPPWHWVPLGALVMIAVGAVLAKSFYVPYVQRRVEAVYGHPRTTQEYDQIDQQLTNAARDALHWQLLWGALPIAVASVALGGFVVGRFGARTNQRHGTLAGIAAMVLLLLVAGRGARSWTEVGAYAAMIPFGAITGYLGALAGIAVRPRE